MPTWKTRGSACTQSWRWTTSGCASADAQIKLLDDTVKAYQSALQLTQDRFEGGAAPQSDVAQAQTQLDQARVQRTDLEVQRTQYEHAIAVLIGKPPAELTLAASASELSGSCRFRRFQE